MNASVLIFVFSVLQIAWCLAVADEQLIVKHEADEFRRGNLRRLTLSETGALVLIRKNLLTNPSFELDDFGTRGIRDGLAAGWAIWGKGYGTYSDLSVPSLVPDATHGRRAQRIDIKAPEGKPLLFLSAVRGERYVKPEQYYTFSADVKVSDPATAKVRLQIQFFSHGKWLDGKFSEETADTEYKRLSVTARAPEKTDLIKPVVFVEPVKAGAECSIVVDSVQLEISEAPSDFCAGYSAETGEFISPPIDLGETTRPYRLDCLMSHPSPVDIRLQIRSAPTREGLNRAEWLGLAGSDGFYAYYGEDGPPVLETSVEELVELFTKRLDIRLEMDASVPSGKLLGLNKLALFRVVKEAVGSIREHGGEENSIRVVASLVNSSDVPISDSTDSVEPGKLLMVEIFTAREEEKEMDKKSCPLDGGLKWLELQRLLVDAGGGLVENHTQRPSPNIVLYLPLLKDVVEELAEHEPFKVLVVDDQEDVARTLAEYFRFLGEEADFSLVWEEALEQVRRTRPDLVFLDMSIGHLSLGEMLDELAEAGAKKIAVSSGTPPDENRKMDLAQRGVTWFLQKPVTLRDIKRLMSRLIANGERPSRGEEGEKGGKE